jgi:hypothetical protein
VGAAIAALRRALRDEDGLEWSGLISECISELTYIRDRLRDYAGGFESR